MAAGTKGRDGRVGKGEEGGDDVAERAGVVPGEGAGGVVAHGEHVVGAAHADAVDPAGVEDADAVAFGVGVGGVGGEEEEAGVAEVVEEVLKGHDAPEKDRFWCRHLAGSSQVRRGRPTGETTLYLGPKWFRAFRDLEAGATEIMEVCSAIITGILQTEAYTRAMYLAQGVHPEDQQIEDTIKVRAERKQLLTREHPPRYSFVLSESALRRNIGGPTVMAEQLSHLAELALLPNVSLQVIPFNTQSYAPVRNNFTAFRFGRDRGEDIVYIELFDDAAYLDKPPETVRKYPELFRQLQGIALGPIESRNFILELAEHSPASTRG